MRILLFLFLFTVPLAFGQIKFFRVYSGNNDDTAKGVVQLEDSSYMITGASGSFTANSSQAFLLKLDSLGNTVWAKNYGGSESEEGKRVLYVPGQFLYIAGFTNSISNGAYDFYLVKTDLSGNMLWEKAYGRFGWERVHDATTTADGGVIMVGETSSTELNDLDMYMVRADQNGDTLWTKQLGTSGDDILESVVQLNDSIFYAFGSTYVEDSLMNKAYSMCFHENGSVLWTGTYGANGNYYLHGACLDNANEIIAVGHAEGSSHLSMDYLFIRLLPDGTVIDISTGQSEGIQEYKLVTAYGQGSDKYIGWSYLDQWSAGTGNAVAISKHNDQMGWEQTGVVVNFAEPDEINDLIPTSDGGAIGVGRTHEQFGSSSRFYVAKIGPNDDYPQEWATTPYSIEGFVSLDETDELNSTIRVFPNPSGGMLTIQKENTNELELRLMSTSGHVIYEQILTNTIQLDLSYLESGMYYLIFSSDHSSGTKKVIIRK